MLRQKIKYIDFDNNEVTEEFYFNLTRAEIVELQLSMPGEQGLMGVLTEAVKRQDANELIHYMKMLIGKSYGKRTADGKSFIKSDAFTEEFFSSEAYSELFMSFFGPDGGNLAAEFVNGLMPPALVKQAMAQQSVETPTRDVEMKLEVGKTYTEVDPKDVPAWQREGRLPTKAEIQKMSPDEIVLAMNAKIASK